MYVDDLVFTGNDYEEINHITSLLDTRFKIKNLGDLTYFMDLGVARNNQGLLTHMSTQICFGPSPRNRHDELCPYAHGSLILAFFLRGYKSQ